MQEQRNIIENFTFQLHAIFDKFNRCNYISDNFINSDELHNLTEYYNYNQSTINDEYYYEETEFTHIMNNVCYLYHIEFGSFKANYKSRLYLKLWLKKLIINIW